MKSSSCHIYALWAVVFLLFLLAGCGNDKVVATSTEMLPGVAYPVTAGDTVVSTSADPARVEVLHKSNGDRLVTLISGTARIKPARP